MLRLLHDGRAPVRRCGPSVADNVVDVLERLLKVRRDCNWVVVEAEQRVVAAEDVVALRQRFVVSRAEAAEDIFVVGSR